MKPYCCHHILLSFSSFSRVSIHEQWLVHVWVLLCGYDIAVTALRDKISMYLLKSHSWFFKLKIIPFRSQFPRTIFRISQQKNNNNVSWILSSRFRSTLRSVRQWGFTSGMGETYLGYEQKPCKTDKKLTLVNIPQTIFFSLIGNTAIAAWHASWNGRTTISVIEFCCFYCWNATLENSSGNWLRSEFSMLVYTRGYLDKGPFTVA